MKDKTIKSGAKKSLSTLKLKEYGFATALLSVSIVLFLIFGLYSQILSIQQCFQEVDMLGNRTFLPASQMFSNFASFINQAFNSESIVYTSIINSLYAYLLCFIITNPLYFFFAYFMYKKVFGTKFFGLVAMLPEIISALIFSLIFKKIVEGPLIELMGFLGVANFPNLINSYEHAFGVTLFYRIWVSFGSSCIIYSNAMAAIDPEILESSRVDGVDNMFQEIWHIIFPLIYPTFSTLLILSLSTIFTVDNGLVTFYMYGAPPAAYNLGYYFTVRIFNSSSMGYPVLSAGGLMLTLILTPIVFTLKHYIEKIDPTR